MESQLYNDFPSEHQRASEPIEHGPSAIGPQGLPLKHGTAHHPIDAYRSEAGPTGILVDTGYYRYWLLGPAYASARPHILVNGIEVRETKWGLTQVPVGPGVHHLEVFTGGPNRFWSGRTWSKRQPIGFADAAVPVRSGQQTTVHYRSPSLYLFKGAIGPEPMECPGMWWVWVSWALIGSLALMILYGVIADLVS